MRSAFSILIVEDELMIAEMSKEMLQNLGYNVVGVAKNFEKAQSFFSGSYTIDMAILDVNLEASKNGIDVGKMINEKYKIPFIYLTSYSDPKTIRNAATTSPAAYLLKPFTKGDLHATIEMIRARKNDESQSVVVKDGHLNVKVQSKDIRYVKSDNNYIEIVTVQKKFIVRNSLEQFLKEVDDPNLVRIHRSYVANILKIDAINGQYVLIGDEKCPLSRSYKDEVFRQFTYK